MRTEKWNLYINTLQGHPSVCQSGHTKESMKFITEYIPPDKFPKLLNIGAGEGLETDILRQLDYDVIGLIHGNINLVYANNNFPLTKYIQSDMHDLPFPSNSFDAIYTNHTFEHSFAPFIQLLEMYSILRENGRVWIAMPEFKEYNDPTIGDPNKLNHHHPNIICYNLLKQMFESTGFKIIYCKPIPNNPYYDNPYLLEKQPLSSLHSDVKTAVLERTKLYGDKSVQNIQPINQNKHYQNTNIEIIGITTSGTYPSWIDYCTASIYNHVDKVIVVNAGYDINHPEKGALIPLEREHKLIKKIDIHNKIIEYTPTQSDINNLFSTTCKQGKDEFGRSTNITLSTQIANKLPNPDNKQRWILKLDSDQILFPITRYHLESLIKQYPTKSGFRFAQYADYYHNFEHISAGLPNEFTNDGALFYISKPDQWYTGQGSPVINTSQHPITSIRTAHMRRINPSDVEPYDYHFKRIFYHTYAPDSIMELDYNRKTGKHLTYKQIIEIAHKEAISILKNKGRLIKDLQYDERIPYEPPLVLKMSPLEYIKKGY